MKTSQARHASKTPDPSPPTLPVFAPGTYGPVDFLTPSQAMAYRMDAIEPRSAFCIVGIAIRVTGPLNIEAALRSSQAVLDRHESVRTTMKVVEGVPRPVVHAHVELKMPTIDLSDMDPESREREVQRIRRRAGCTPFDLQTGPLMRCRLLILGDDEHELHYEFHHIVFDGWTRALTLFEFSMFYQAFCTDSAPWVSEPVPYSDYAAWQSECLRGETLEAMRAHWRARVEGMKAVSLPTDRPRTLLREPALDTISVRLSDETRAGVKALAKAEGVSRFDVLFTAYTVMLGRLAGIDDVTVTVPFGNRPQATLRTVAGFAANMLPLRARLDEAADFRALLRANRGCKATAKAWQALPFDTVRGMIAADGGEDPLSRVWFDLMDARAEIPLYKLKVKWVQLPRSFAVGLDLMLVCFEHAQSIETQWLYSTALFDRETVDRMIALFDTIVDTMVAGVERSLDDLVWPGGLPPWQDEAATIRAAAHAIEAVSDCHVIERASPYGPELCVYYAAGRSLTPSRLRGSMKPALAAIERPVTFAAVSRLPRDGQGAVDESALLRAPVVDELLADRWQAALRGLGGTSLTVSTASALERPPALHLSDVLPSAPAAAVLGTSTMAPVVSAGSLEAADEPMALAHGGPLNIPVGTPTTFTEVIRRAAAGSVERGMVYIDLDGRPHRQSYAELFEAARRVRTGLARAGVKPGGAAMIQIADAREYFPAFWGCVLGGITPVTVAIPSNYALDNAVVAKLHNTWTLLDRPPILASASVVEPLRALGAERQQVEGAAPLTVLSIDELGDNPPTEPIYEARPDDLMFFQLTSGSTGTPKVIRETHQGIIRHIVGSQQVCDYRSDDVCLNWLARDHVVPILTFHLKGVFLGCEQVEVPIQTVLGDPLRWLDLMETYRATHSWAPNFGYKNVANALRDAPDRSWDLSAVKYLMNAGEQVTRPVVHEFMSQLEPFGLRPEAMQPAFGMAEVCTCMTYENDFDIVTSAPTVRKASLSGRLEDTWPGDPDGISFVLNGPPMPGVSVRITDSQNRVLPERVIGRLQIKGGVVTPGYLKNPEANSEAFVGDGWFNTGDLGFLRDRRLAITGREKEMIIINGANHYCYEIEDVVERIDGVEPSFVAACGVADAASGTEQLAIFYCPSHDPAFADRPLIDAELIGTIETTLARGVGIRPAHVIPLEHAAFPKTTSGKIQRSLLKKRLMGGHFGAVQKAIDIAVENERTIPDFIFEPVWRPRALGPDRQPIAGRRFVVCGGDSELGVDLIERLGAAGARVDVAGRATSAGALADIGADGPAIDEIIYLLPDAPADWDGPDGLLGILAALQAGAGSRPDGHPLTLRTVGRIGSGLAHGGVAGILGAAARENAWLGCAVIELGPGDGVFDALLSELGSPVRRSVLQRVRLDGTRSTPALAPVRTRSDQTVTSPLVTGGFYVISGGLGDLAVEVAAHLMSTHEARVLLLGRTPLERRDGGSAIMGRLARLLGEAIYAAVDVTDGDAVAAAVHDARLRFDRAPDGVFHLAGSFGQCNVLDLEPAALKDAMHAKVAGALSLARVIQDQPDAIFVAFSSVNSVFPGATIGSYAAANGALDAFAVDLRRRGVRAFSLGWSLWRGQGMSKAFAELEELATYAGYRLLGRDQAIRAMQVALVADRPHVLIGLDPASPAMASQIVSEPGRGARSALTLHARPAAGSRHLTAAFVEAAAALDVSDRYGTSARSAFALHRQPAHDAAGSGRTGMTAPTTATERDIAEIWCDVLALERVDVHADIFELGGTSMAAAQIFARLQVLAGRTLSVAELFRFRTIHQLATHLDA